MSITRISEQTAPSLPSSPLPQRQDSKLQASDQTLTKVPDITEVLRYATARYQPRPRPELSYTVFKRDVLYRAINEFQLTGSRISAYTELLSQLGFDLSPLVSQDQTWYFCRGKQKDGSPCQRMVPEVYLRTAVGKILQASDRSTLQGDDLIENLATAFSYAICSEHHHKIHKVARAIDARKVVEQWREAYGLESWRTGPARLHVSVYDRAQQHTPSLFKQHQAQPNVEWSHQRWTGYSTSDEVAELDDTSERLTVERHYQAYLRASNRDIGGGIEELVHYAFTQGIGSNT